MSFIDSNGLAWEQRTSGLAPVVSLSGKSATSSVPVVLDGTVVRTNAAMVVTSSSGVSAGAVTLQGSLDGTNWFALGSAVSTSSASTTFTPVVQTGVLVRFVRAAITTTITGGTISAAVALSG
jgi:hypothetical protein